MKKLPIGIQTFENLIEEGYAYVDKTRFVAEIAAQNKYYFLSRPRRFGKSLLLSTLKAAFEGKRELFQGLYLYDNWDWEQTNPVVHISFGSGVVRSVQELQTTFDEILYDHAKYYHIDYVKKSLKGRFSELITTLEAMFNQKVVVLIDEYDKPILDSIHKPELAREIREELKNYYSVLKDSDPYLRLVFITGVSKFSKVSLFSGLNNLEDITLTPGYSALCGYTQKELEKVFAEYLEGVDLDEVRTWYNGYNWLGEKVYNPFDILLFLKQRSFSNFWFETGTPTFLIQLLRQGRYLVPEIEELEAGEEVISSFDVDNIAVETLLFQTGYLTLKSFEQIGAFRRYGLGFPNLEVKSSLCNSILSAYCKDRIAKTRNQSRLLDALIANDLEGMRDVFQAFFASIPYDWYHEQQAAGYEAYYASVVYCYFAATGIDVRPEVHTNAGRIDLVVRFDERIYLIEFKVLEQCGPGKALEQIQTKGYAEQFAGHEVYLVGVEFSSKERNITQFVWERQGEDGVRF
jgi:Holliday junction resolvase-like predicted endonuclease